MSEQTTGIHFPLIGERRSTTATTRGILADAARHTDPALASRIEEAANWRRDYVDHVHALTAASSISSRAAIDIAEGGLRAMRQRMVMIADDGSEAPLADARLDVGSASRFGTETVRGTGTPHTELVVPHRNGELRGDALRRQLDAWVAAGIVEDGFRAAIMSVMENPEWLTLPDHQVTLIGAGAEMGPLEPLLDWGCDVLAIDLPRSEAWRRKRGVAARSAGSLTFPIDAQGHAGGDIVHQPGQVLDWIRRTRDGSPLVLGMHAYADSGVHVRISAAADLLTTMLLDDDPDTALAWLATPTDAFVVGEAIVADARAQWEGRGKLARVTQSSLRTVSRGRLYRRAYPDATDGAPGVADIIVPQQGPNYSIAKRLQRWRGVAAEQAGHTVSFNVAPATLTRSVTKNPVLGAAYGGARRFGVEVFEPETVRPLMAALMVHDVMRGPVTREHPEELFSDAAAHGGLWRVGYDPKSVLGIAAMEGLPKQLLKRR